MPRNCSLNDTHRFKVFKKGLGQKFGPGRNSLDCQLYPVSEWGGAASAQAKPDLPSWWSWVLAGLPGSAGSADSAASF